MVEQRPFKSLLTRINTGVFIGFNNLPVYSCPRFLTIPYGSIQERCKLDYAIDFLTVALAPLPHCCFASSIRTDMIRDRSELKCRIRYSSQSSGMRQATRLVYGPKIRFDDDLIREKSKLNYVSKRINLVWLPVNGNQGGGRIHGLQISQSTLAIAVDIATSRR